MTSTEPVQTLAPGASNPGLRATNVAVAVALTQTPEDSPVSQSMPDGRSTAKTFLPAWLMAAIADRYGSRSVPHAPVPSKASTIQSADASS